MHLNLLLVACLTVTTGRTMRRLDLNARDDLNGVMLDSCEFGQIKRHPPNERIICSRSRDVPDYGSREPELNGEDQRAVQFRDHDREDKVNPSRDALKSEVEHGSATLLERRYSRLEPRVHASSIKATSGKVGDSTSYVAPGNLKMVTDGSVVVAGPNGCTALFIFGLHHIVCAYLAAGREVLEAERAATIAESIGPVRGVEIITAKIQTVQEVSAQVKRILEMWVDPRKIVYDDRKHHTEGYWYFKATVGNQVVRKVWKDGAFTISSESPSPSKSKRDRERSPVTSGRRKSSPVRRPLGR